MTRATPSLPQDRFFAELTKFGVFDCAPDHFGFELSLGGGAAESSGGGGSEDTTHIVRRQASTMYASVSEQRKSAAKNMMMMGNEATMEYRTRVERESIPFMKLLRAKKGTEALLGKGKPKVA